MKQLLERQMPPGFPVKYVFPIMLDIKVEAAFTNFEVKPVSPDAFKVPDDYQYTTDIKIEAASFFKQSKKILDKKKL